MSIVKEKPISSITIKEICSRADINRSTFYAHYSNQYELLYAIEEEFIEDMIVTLRTYNLSNKEDSYEMTEKILEYIAENSEVCKTLLSENSDIHFQKKGMEITKQFILKNWIHDDQLDQEKIEYISLFVGSGSIHVIKSWLDKGMNKTPREMAEIINNFTNKGLLDI